MIYVYLDAETIPGQAPHIRDMIAEKHPLPPLADRDAIAASIPIPGNRKKPEAIEDWKRDTLPGLIEKEARKSQEGFHAALGAREKAYHNCGFSASTGELVSLGFAFDEEPVRGLYRNSINDTDNEAEMLSIFFEVLEKKTFHSPGAYDEPHYVTHNGNDFDLPFIWQRALILGVRVPRCWPRPMQIKPWGGPTTDTMLMWDANRQRKIGMDRLCQLFGFPTKGDEGDLSGADVWPAIQAGRYEDVNRYCKRDVEALRRVHRRMLQLD